MPGGLAPNRDWAPTGRLNRPTSKWERLLCEDKPRISRPLTAPGGPTDSEIYTNFPHLFGLSFSPGTKKAEKEQIFKQISCIFCLFGVPQYTKSTLNEGKKVFRKIIFSCTCSLTSVYCSEQKGKNLIANASRFAKGQLGKPALGTRGNHVLRDQSDLPEC